MSSTHSADSEAFNTSSTIPVFESAYLNSMRFSWQCLGGRKGRLYLQAVSEGMYQIDFLPREYLRVGKVLVVVECCSK